MKKKILMYAHYYVPDVASTAQILQDLAEGMKEKFDVTVICAVPSYTGIINEEYKKRKYYYECINGVNIVRVSVPEFTKSSKLSRIKNLFMYYIRSRKVTKKLGFHDYVFAISQPPILGGMLGVYGKYKLKTSNSEYPKFIYCIQDYNPEQIEAINYINNKLLINILKLLDKRNCKKSDLVVTVGRDLIETLKNRFNNDLVPKYVMINNWADEKKIYPLSSDDPGVIEFKKTYGLENKFIFMYSGNIGLYYDLEGLIKVMKEFKNVKTSKGRDVIFVFVGTGGILNKLILYSKENKLNNIVFIPYQSKDKLIYSLNASDVQLCVNAKKIKGVSCPSKFYGIACAGKPVLGVLENGSEVEMLIHASNCGKCSEPGDYEEVKKNIKWFISHDLENELVEMGSRGREYIDKKLAKDMSIMKYIKAIKEI